MHQELNPHFYGLPDAPWNVGLDIISLAMNFWSADKSTFLDAGITCIHLPSGSGSNSEERTLYFKSKNCEVLRNPNQSTVSASSIASIVMS